MKKFFMAAMAAMMMIASPVMAQNETEVCNNEVSASIGVGNAVQIFDGFTSALAGKSDTPSVTFNIDYSRRIYKGVSLGVTLNYFEGSKRSGSNENDKYYTVMPHLKVNYINKKKFTLYGKYGVGLLVNTYKEMNNGVKESKTKTFTAFQISPIGAEFGPNEHIRFFGELGLGMAGTGQLGVRYKF